MKIRQGDIIGFSGNSFISWSIKKITKSKWSHCGIVYAVSQENIIIAEALSNGFILNTHKKEKLQKKIRKGKAKVRKVPDDVSFYSPTLVVRRYLRTKYGHFQIFLNAVSLVFRKKIKGDKDKTMTCSEAVAVCLFDMTRGKINIADEFNTTQDFIYPSHIMKSSQLEDKTGQLDI